ncbi:hypothetical protein I6F66_10045 [Pseudoalteromonas sp. NZS100_1]|uniref:hypothetical protein n=1 Tax=Pseudoalteromonas sp. NZS100_1 TaxID=2792073 RepID=UPI0018CC8874|nr:hypothetical protein [Pseudoalteromonas sp. NZS100_1]MBH0012436.1 hypothetical protein [Pseudoalteromonas sp. NZS100_1]
MNKKKNAVKNSRDEILKNLSDLLEEALRASLIAQLCARGKSLSEAKEGYQNLTEKEVETLIEPEGASGYLNYQWISESIVKAKEKISEINLQDFWEFVRAEKNTNNIYESHLKAAQLIINNRTSGLQKNIKELYDKYPENKVTRESLPIIRQIQEAAKKIEYTIEQLLSLSPPAKRRALVVSRKFVIVLFMLSLISIPLLYWIGAEIADSSEGVSSKIEQDVSTIKATAEKSPANLPKLVFSEVVPLASNILLLISIALGLIRTFSHDSLKDTKRMSKELTKAAKLLRELG